MADRTTVCTSSENSSGSTVYTRSPHSMNRIPWASIRSFLVSTPSTSSIACRANCSSGRRRRGWPRRPLRSPSKCRRQHLLHPAHFCRDNPYFLRKSLPSEYPESRDGKKSSLHFFTFLEYTYFCLRSAAWSVSSAVVPGTVRQWTQSKRTVLRPVNRKEMIACA